MASIINSDNGVISGTAGLKSTGANDGALNIQTNGTNAITISSSQTVAINGNNISADNSLGFRNRIINGAMVVNQHGYTTASPLNVGAGAFTYMIDRFSAYVSQTSKMTFGQATVAPSGFINSLNATTTTAYSIAAGDLFMLTQPIEGLNVADLAWGTASAATVTLSFRVYSSLTGTFGGSILNSAYNRSYPFTYSVPTANTWTTIAITIPGDTSGTWLTTNGVGIRVSFGLGMGSTYSGTAGAWAGSQFWSATSAVSVVGTGSATFYITGVQLEVGSVATPFERRPYGTELALCQRYYEQANMAVYSTVTRNSYSYHVPKRTNPSSVTLTTGTIVNSYEDFASFSHGSDAATTMKINAEL